MRRGARPLGDGIRRPTHRRPFAFASVAGWFIVALYAAGVCANLWFEGRLGLLDEDPLQGVVLLVGFGAFAVVGALVVPRDPSRLGGDPAHRAKGRSECPTRQRMRGLKSRFPERELG